MKRLPAGDTGMLTGLVVLLCMLAACSHDDNAASQAAAAKAATPSPFAPRSHELIETVEVRPTVAKTPDESGEGTTDEDYDPVYVAADGDPTSGGSPLTVQFEAEVTGGPPGLRYRWDFGDHSPVARQTKVEHTYDRPGEYTATFSVSGAGVEESQEVSVEVTEEGFDVDLNADPDIGQVPLKVDFSAVLDEDLPGPFQFQWNFGDGGRDVSNPTTHTYRVAGEYTATLTVTNALGQVATREVELQVDPPEAGE